MPQTYPPQYGVRTKAKKPDVRDDVISRALLKASGIEPVVSEGEKTLGPGRPGRVLDAITNFFVPKEPTMLDVLTAGIPVAKLPIGKLVKILTEGRASNLLGESSSSILRRWPAILEREGSDIESISGSMAPARVASGQHPFVNRSQEFSRPELRQAQDEYYRITQQLLDELGVSENEALEVFRGGPISMDKWFLNPTSVDPEIASTFARYNPHDVSKTVRTFNPSRTSIRALPGVLARGDEITMSEMLVPSSSLRKTFQGPGRLSTVPSSVMLRETSGEAVARIPSRLRQIVAEQAKQERLREVAERIADTQRSRYPSQFTR